MWIAEARHRFAPVGPLEKRGTLHASNGFPVMHKPRAFAATDDFLVQLCERGDHGHIESYHESRECPIAERLTVVAQFESRFTGKGPSMSLKNKTNSAIERIAIHHGLSTIGNKTTSSHAHQGISDHRLLPIFVGFASLSMRGKSTSELPLDSKNFKLTHYPASRQIDRAWMRG